MKQKTEVILQIYHPPTGKYVRIDRPITYLLSQMPAVVGFQVMEDIEVITKNHKPKQISITPTETGFEYSYR
jgi:hypothetical protein